MIKDSSEIFKIQSKDGRVVGVYLPTGKVRINRGSFFRNSEVNSLRQNIKNIRSYLLNNDYIKDNQISKEFVFDSPSEAISALMGHMENGNNAFITLDNIELGDYLNNTIENKTYNEISKLYKEGYNKSKVNGNGYKIDRNEDDEFKIVTSVFDEDFESIVPEYSPVSVGSKNNKETTSFKRDIRKARKALTLANFQCEINKDHITFLTKYKKPYMEAHHLIPLGSQDKFKYSLDVDANIVCLCPTCHRMLHYGDNTQFLIKELYNNRIEFLKLSGIGITLNELISYY